MIQQVSTEAAESRRFVQTPKSFPLIPKKGARNAQCFPNLPVLRANERVTAYLEGSWVFIYDKVFSQRFHQHGCFGVLQPETERFKRRYGNARQQPLRYDFHLPELELYESACGETAATATTSDWFSRSNANCNIDLWPEHGTPQLSQEFWNSSATDYQRFLFDSMQQSLQSASLKRANQTEQSDQTTSSAAKRPRLALESDTANSSEFQQVNSRKLDMEIEAEVRIDEEPQADTQINRQTDTKTKRPRNRRVSTLRLSVDETLFLMFSTHSISRLIDASRGAFDTLTIDEFARICALQDPHFVARFCAYQHFRSRGWVLRAGLKFGVDFVAYRDGPQRYHASFSVVARTVLPETSANDESVEETAEEFQQESEEDDYDWADEADQAPDRETLCVPAPPCVTTFNDHASPSEFAGLSRVTEQVRKHLVYAFVTFSTSALDSLLQSQTSDSDRQEEEQSDSDGQSRFEAFLNTAHVTCMRVLRWNANAQRDVGH